jgi:hypothetical protein
VWFEPNPIKATATCYQQIRTQPGVDSSILWLGEYGTDGPTEPAQARLETNKPRGQGTKAFDAKVLDAKVLDAKVLDACQDA